MSPETVVQLTRHTMETVLWMAAPILIVATVVSLLVNIIQVVTSIQDITISTVPRLASVAIAILLLIPWLLRRITTFAISLFSDFHPYVT